MLYQGFRRAMVNNKWSTIPYHNTFHGIRPILYKAIILFFTWDVVVSSNLNENALPRKSFWRDCIKYGANPNWIEYLIFVLLCLYPLAIYESGNIYLNNFPLPSADANEKLESTALSASNISALITDSFDEKTNTCRIQWNCTLVLTSFFML